MAWRGSRGRLTVGSGERACWRGFSTRLIQSRGKNGLEDDTSQDASRVEAGERGEVEEDKPRASADALSSSSRHLPLDTRPFPPRLDPIFAMVRMPLSSVYWCCADRGRLAGCSPDGKCEQAGNSPPNRRHCPQTASSVRRLLPSFSSNQLTPSPLPQPADRLARRRTRSRPAHQGGRGGGKDCEL